MADFSLPGDYAVTFSVDIEDFRPENNSLPPIATGKVDVYDGGLPFRERFAGPGQTHWGNRVVVPGSTAATFLTSSKFGRMYKGPGGHITAGLKDETADLLFTLDLSDYDASRDRLMLKTLLTSYSNEVSPNNQIFVRGNADLPWLPLYNWGAQQDDGVSRNLMITTISEVLQSGGQQYGEAFQLRFGLEQKTHNFNSLMGLRIGNVTIGYMPDVAVVSGTVPEVDPLLGDREPISITIENKGGIPVSGIPVSAQIRYIDGPKELQSPPPSTQDIWETAPITLGPGERATHEFTKAANFGIPGNYEVTYSAAMPDDADTGNDTLAPIATGKMAVHSGPLPFREDFEGALDSLNARGRDIAVVPWLQSAAFLTNGPSGRLDFVGRPGESATRQGRIGATAPEETADLVFTLDLGVYDLHEDRLELELWAASDTRENRIDVRGSADLPWLPLYDWELATKEHIKIGTIGEVLQEGGQRYGETFQLRFRHQGPGSLRLDDIVIRNTTPNTAPELVTGIPDQQLTEGFGTQRIDLVPVFTDKEQQTLAFAVAVADTLVVTADIADKVLTLTEGAPGTTTITVTADDGHRGSANDVFGVALMANRPPTIARGTLQQQLTEGFDAHTIDLSEVFNDPDGHELTLSAGSDRPEAILAVLEGHLLRLVENKKSTGTTTITIRADDGHGGRVSHIFDISVNALPRVSNEIPDQRLTKGFGTHTVDLAEAFYDPDGHSLALHAVATDGTIVVLGIDGTVLTLTERTAGTTTITVTADDGHGGRVSDMFTMQVNRLPVVATEIPDQQLTTGFGTHTIDLAEAFDDPDGHTLFLTSNSDNVQVLTVHVLGDRLTLTEVGTGTATISVGADDGHGGRVEDTFAVRVIANAFISTWRTSTANEQIHLPLVAGGSYDFTVDWGDGSSNTLSAYDRAGASHSYATAGTHTVTITGRIQGWSFNNGGSREKIRGISAWGPLRLGRTSGHFFGCNNLEITATDLLDTSEVTSFRESFRGCSSLGRIPRMQEWDMDQVTDMESMFLGASSFDQDLGNWNVGHVTDMGHMFYQATHFDGDIGNWNVEKVTDMGYMFGSASRFDQDIARWNVGRVTDMSGMFWRASSFDRDLGNWDVGNVADMDHMFYQATRFDRNIGNWNVGHVTDMENMFLGATLSTPNYDALLTGWESRAVQDNVIFHGGGSRYTGGSDAATARTALIDDHNWTITDGGAVGTAATARTAQITGSKAPAPVTSEVRKADDFLEGPIMYPNPTDGLLTLRSSHFSEWDATFHLHDAAGRASEPTTLRKDGKTYELDLSGKPAGVYFLTMEFGDGSIIKKKVFVR